jgi:hypothetical protein
VTAPTLRARTLSGRKEPRTGGVIVAGGHRGEI